MKNLKLLKRANGARVRAYCRTGESFSRLNTVEVEIDKSLHISNFQCYWQV